MAIFHSYFDITRGYSDLNFHHVLPLDLVWVLIMFATSFLQQSEHKRSSLLRWISVKTWKKTPEGIPDIHPAQAWENVGVWMPCSCKCPGAIGNVLHRKGAAVVVITRTPGVSWWSWTTRWYPLVMTVTWENPLVLWSFSIAILTSPGGRSH